MVQAMLPNAQFVDLGPDGGPYDEMAHPKVCWHTTEGSSIAGAEAAFLAYPPHLCYDPRSRVLRQYVRLDRHSYALRGGESDDEYVIQIELVGRAGETAFWPDECYRNIGEDLVAPLRRAIGVPDHHLRFYGPHDGIVLASPTSPIRLSDAAFRAFSGHLGHQHVPAPDAHWDPGGFRIDKALDQAQEDDMEPNTPVTFGRKGITLAFSNWLGETWDGAQSAARDAAVVRTQMAALTQTLSDDEANLLAAVQRVADAVEADDQVVTPEQLEHLADALAAKLPPELVDDFDEQLRAAFTRAGQETTP